MAEAGGEASDAARGAGSSLKVPFFACGELFLSEALSTPRTGAPFFCRENVTDVFRFVQVWATLNYSLHASKRAPAPPPPCAYCSDPHYPGLWTEA